MKLRDRAGFTLLELIVTFTILSIVLVMVLGALRLGTSAWERGGDKAEQYQKRRMVLSLLSQQLKSAYPYKIKAEKAESDYLAFDGKGDSLRFVSTLSLKARRPEGLVYVVYQVEEGRSSEKILKVYEARVLNKDFMEETPAEDLFVSLLEDLADIKFEYFKEPKDEEEEGEWVESWDAKEQKQLPSQVRVAAKWKDKEEELVVPSFLSLPAHKHDDRGRPAPRPTPVLPRGPRT